MWYGVLAPRAKGFALIRSFRVPLNDINNNYCIEIEWQAILILLLSTPYHYYKHVNEDKSIGIYILYQQLWELIFNI